MDSGHSFLNKKIFMHRESAIVLDINATKCFHQHSYRPQDKDLKILLIHEAQAATAEKVK